MFDTVPPTDRPFEPAFDIELMVRVLSHLDAAELARVEDDLDFYHFTGAPSPRLRSLFHRAARLRSAA